MTQLPVLTQAVGARSKMSDKPKAWRSPKAWLTSGAIVGLVWFGVYLITGQVAAATVIAAIFILVGIAGALYMMPIHFPIRALAIIFALGTILYSAGFIVRAGISIVGELFCHGSRLTLLAHDVSMLWIAVAMILLLSLYTHRSNWVRLH